LIGTGGLLERVYAGLKLPSRAWPGLTRLPEVGGISDRQRPHYMALVGNHMKVWAPDRQLQGTLLSYYTRAAFLTPASLLMTVGLHVGKVSYVGSHSSQPCRISTPDDHA